jgi:hypothetical protein
MVKKIKKYKIPLFLFLVTFIIYFLSKEKTYTSWNHYVRLANSFLHGKLSFLNYQSYLEAAFFKGNHFLVSPPLPAIISMPFVFFFGEKFPQPLISFFFGALNPAILYLFFLKIKIKQKIAFASSLLLAFGTNHWYLSSVGSYWYLAHVISVTFILLALNEFFGKKRLPLVGFLIGCAYWTRLPTIISSLFFILFIFTQKNLLNEKIKDCLKLFLPIIIFVLLNSLYNFLRFESFLDKGYTLIPNVLNESWYQKGIFSLSYIPRNLKLIFLATPPLIKNFPFFTPTLFGMAIWLTTPAFLLLPKALFIKEKIILFSFLTTLFLSIPSLTHGSGGTSQFGYRFSLDYLPFLLILTAKASEKLPKWVIVPLFFLSLLVNLWGVLYFNKLSPGR